MVVSRCRLLRETTPPDAKGDEKPCCAMQETCANVAKALPLVAADLMASSAPMLKAAQTAQDKGKGGFAASGVKGRWVFQFVPLRFRRLWAGCTTSVCVR